MLKLSKFTKILINISTKLILPMVDNEPVSLYQPLFRNRSETNHIARAITNGPIQCNDDMSVDDIVMNSQESTNLQTAVTHIHLLEA